MVLRKMGGAMTNRRKQLAVIGLVGAVVSVATVGCSSNYYLDPSSGDRRVWAEDLNPEDHEMLCATFWGDEGYRNDPGKFRSMLRDDQFGPGWPRHVAEAVTNMVASGEGCPGRGGN